MDDFDLEMQLGFLDEAKELLTSAERCFLCLEKSKDDPAVIEEIFRLAHNLKGSAGAVGFAELTEFAHHLESFLLKVKNQEIPVDSDVVNLLLACNDHLCAMIEGLRANAKGSFPNPALTARLEAYLSGAKPAASAAPDERYIDELAELTRSTIDPGTLGSEPSAFASEPSAFAAEPGAFATGPSAFVPEPSAPAPEPAASAAAPKNAAPADESIRVNLSRIDRLMNNVGELVILQTVMSQQKDVLPSSLQRHTVGQMEKIIREVQEISMSLRMVPLKQTFQKMQRIVRDTSKARTPSSTRPCSSKSAIRSSTWCGTRSTTASRCPTSVRDRASPARVGSS